MQKSVAFLYINNEQSKEAVKKVTSFIIPLKRINYVGIFLTKEVKTCALKTTKHC
jgi:hypothetical protein